jgi:iron complex transport system substrate-binding protein
MTAPARIVSLISSATEILFAIGAGPRVVAVSHECDYPRAAQRLPKATRSLIDSSKPSGEIDRQVATLAGDGGALYTLDAELIRDLRPDLIVTQAQCDVCAVRYADVIDLVDSDPALRGAQVVALNPTRLEDVFDDIRRVGAVAGCEPEAGSFAQSLRERVANVERAAEGVRLAAPRVACIEWVEPLMLAANWTPELIRLAGGSTDQSRAGQHSVYGKWQELLQFDPEVLIVAPCGFDLQRSLDESQALMLRPGWSDLAAVQLERVWIVDGNAYLNRSGPRLVDSLEILAHLIRPDVFGFPPWADERQRSWARFI